MCASCIRKSTRPWKGTRAFLSIWQPKSTDTRQFCWEFGVSWPTLVHFPSIDDEVAYYHDKRKNADDGKIYLVSVPELCVMPIKHSCYEWHNSHLLASTSKIIIAFFQISIVSTGFYWFNAGDVEVALLARFAACKSLPGGWMGMSAWVDSRRFERLVKAGK